MPTCVSHATCDVSPSGPAHVADRGPARGGPEGISGRQRGGAQPTELKPCVHINIFGTVAIRRRGAGSVRSLGSTQEGRRGTKRTRRTARRATAAPANEHALVGTAPQVLAGDAAPRAACARRTRTRSRGRPAARGRSTRRAARSEARSAAVMAAGARCGAVRSAALAHACRCSRSCPPSASRQSALV